ncbi:MAG: choice-of-anchor Q domain-containing protein [Deltaproteobacteria bacterium]|nr:choice-of-anchor Q domain-containing protein [Deltaproteobacteria bacterium]
MTTTRRRFGWIGFVLGAMAWTGCGAWEHDESSGGKDASVDGRAQEDGGADGGQDGCPPNLNGAGCGTCVVFVDGDSRAPYPQGRSWADAYRNVPEAMAAARFATETYGEDLVCEVWVAEGRYFIYGAIPGGGDHREDTIALAPRVRLYGGFDGAETSVESRDPRTHETVLDGHEHEDSDERVLHVITAEDDGMMDGFTVTGGKAVMDDLIPWSEQGGGMLVLDGAPVVSDCVFTNNEGKLGGAVAVVNAALDVSDTRFVRNASTHEGGALYLVSSRTKLASCVLAANTAEDFGGAVFLDYGETSLVNVTSFGNSAGSGGAVHGRPLEAVNSVFFGDSPDEISSSTAQVTYSDVAGGYEGEGNLDADPLFADAAALDLRLLPGSPCVDMGDDASARAADIDGNPRTDVPGAGVPGRISDMGAHELVP